MIIRKLFKAEMAHMVPGAYSKRCQYIHGHSYKFELYVRNHRSNPAGMVLDFKSLKDMGINDFFDSFDHAVMLWDKSAISNLVGKINPVRHLIVPFIPTAEMMAKAAFEVCQAILTFGEPLSGEEGVEVHKVVVHETETGFAEFNWEDLENDSFSAVRFDQWIISDGIKQSWKNRKWYTLVRNALKEKKAVMSLKK